MKSPTKDKTPAMLELDNKILSIEQQVIDLQDRKRKLRAEWLDLREEDWGLVGGETMVREIPQGTIEREGKLGRFEKFYTKWHSGSNWVEVRLINKDGRVGLRKATFYNWEKVES
jgi:hypothetical protein